MEQRDPSYGAEDTKVPINCCLWATGTQLWGRGTQLWGRRHRGAHNCCFWDRGTQLWGRGLLSCP